MRQPTLRRALDAELPQLLDGLFAHGDGAPSVEDKVARIEAYRARAGDRGHALDAALIERATSLARFHADVREQQDRLREFIETLLEPPWFPALLVNLLPPTDGKTRARVFQAGTFRVVALAETVDPESLAIGDEVFLSKELNVIVGRSTDGLPRFGETAVFERWTSGDRLVVRCRDEEMVANAAASLRQIPLRRGDLLRWDRSACLAFEKIDRAPGQRFWLDEVPDGGRERVGGQDRNVEALLSALTAALVSPEKAARYGCGNRQSILLVGPPGCGKTLMARAAAAELRRLTGRSCRIAIVKPAEWESCWVGETQQNIRDCFDALRKAAEEGFVILFLDEVESIGRIRGNVVGHHSDKFLAALLAELDGFVDRSGIAIIAASNRKDLVDPALLERLSDLEITVQRPDMRAAAEILSIHLAELLPYSPNGVSAPETRRQIIDAAVSRLYSPNADNELCLLRFRDGKTRTVAARDVLSGRTLEQLCRRARLSALWRDIDGGEPGVRRSDINDAVTEALERLASTLTMHNVATYLPDLPADVDVVSVEPVTRKVPRPHRYVNLEETT